MNQQPTKRRRGRPRKGEAGPPKPTKQQRQHLTKLGRFLRARAEALAEVRARAAAARKVRRGNTTSRPTILPHGVPVMVTAGVAWNERTVGPPGQREVRRSPTTLLTVPTPAIRAAGILPGDVVAVVVPGDGTIVLKLAKRLGTELPAPEARPAKG